MERKPPKKVRDALRKEVGFGCPIQGCGIPYLEYHHFAPQWNVQPHHNPAGMIALCPKHHADADGGAWTQEQLRQLKRMGGDGRQRVGGRFEWMRERLLGVAGGNLVYDTPILFYCCGQPIIWFTRDWHGYLQVNLRMPRTTTEAELVMQANDWAVSSDVADIDCPPSGRELSVKFHNGDKLRVRFHQLESAEDAIKRYPDVGGQSARDNPLLALPYPLVAVEFSLKVAALDIDIGPKEMVLPRMHRFRGCFARGGRCAFAVGEVNHPGPVGFQLA